MAIRSALERYEDIDMNFAGSREAKLLKARRPLHSDMSCSRLVLHIVCLLLDLMRRGMPLVVLQFPMYCCRLA